MNYSPGSSVISWRATSCGCCVKTDFSRISLLQSLAEAIFAARVLSDHLEVYDLDSIKAENYHEAHKGSAARVRYPLTAEVARKRVLLVDDVSDSGDLYPDTVGLLPLQ